MATTHLSADELAHLAELVAQRGGTAAIESALEDIEHGPRRRSPLRDPWKRDQVLAAYNLKLISRTEARRLLRIRTPR